MTASDQPHSERLVALMEQSCQYHVDSEALIARAVIAQARSWRLADHLQARRLRQQLPHWRTARLGATSIGGLRLSPAPGHGNAY
jgi:hypothetical protein